MDQKTTCNDWAVASSGGSWKAQARNWRLTTRQLELSRVWIPGTYQFSPALSSIPVSTVATAGQRPVDWRSGRGSSRAGAQAMWLVARACKDAAGPQLWLKLARECGSAWMAASLPRRNVLPIFRSKFQCGRRHHWRATCKSTGAGQKRW